MRIRFLFKFIAAALLVFSACTGIKIEQEVKVQPGDWLMAGGSPRQNHVSQYELAPPLELMWDYNVEGGVGPAGICIADAVLFVNAMQGEMFTFDVSTGGKIGNVKFLGKDASTAPLILGNDIIVSYAGDNKYSLASYNLKQGEIKWRKNFGYVQTSPMLKDNYVYFGSLNGVQYKVEAATGKMVWRFETKSPIHSTCALWEDNVIFGNDKGFIYCLNTAEGSERWKLETAMPVISTPMTDEGKAYIGGDDSNYYCIDIATGSVLWKNNLHTKLVAGSALFEKESIITCGVDGAVYSLNKNDGSVRWKFSTRGAITSSPVISGSYIYCASYDGYVYCLNALTGLMLWSRELDNKVRTSPVVWKNYLFVAGDDIVYCFTNKPVIKSDKKN